MASLGQMYNQALADTGAMRTKILPGALDRLQSFNAQDGLERSVRGATDRSQMAFRNNLRDLTGRAVKTGRLNTGFFDEDAGELALDSKTNLDAIIAQYAITAQGQQMSNDNALVNAGQQQEQQYMDLMTGGLDREQMERNRKAQERGSLLKGLATIGGTAIGAMLGGPLGAKLGVKAGALIGGAGKAGKAGTAIGSSMRGMSS